MTAWKLKDITALENAISDDYMAVNFEGKVGDKENEIATAKTDPEWISMAVDEIHTREFGKTAIASVSSPRKERGRMEISSAQSAIPGSPQPMMITSATVRIAIDIILRILFFLPLNLRVESFR